MPTISAEVGLSATMQGIILSAFFWSCAALLTRIEPDIRHDQFFPGLAAAGSAAPATTYRANACPRQSFNRAMMLSR